MGVTSGVVKMLVTRAKLCRDVSLPSDWGLDAKFLAMVRQSAKEVFEIDPDGFVVDWVSKVEGVFKTAGLLQQWDALVAELEKEGVVMRAGGAQDGEDS